MRSKLLIGLVVLLALTAFRHPMHVSVTEIKIDEEDKNVQVITHIFMDDIENRYRVVKGNNELDITEEETKPDFRRFLEGYFKRHMRLTINGKLVEGNFLGYEEEGGGLWCYVEIEKVKKVKTLEVRNTLLIDTFDDQTNLVHVEYHDDISSAKLDSKTISHLFEIQD